MRIPYIFSLFSDSTLKKFLRANFMRQIDFREIAHNKGMKYSEDLLDVAHVPPFIDWSENLIIEHEMHGIINQTPIVLFRYTNIIVQNLGSIRYKQWVVHCRVEKELPRFLVNGRKSGFLSKRFTDFQQLRLEGKFSERFDVYIPTGEHIDALSLLAPDFMWKLYEDHESLDIIFAGQNLWLISKELQDPSATIDDLLIAAHDVLTEVVS